MKALALIKEYNNEDSNHWQFDKIMATIAYDVELTLVFMPDSLNQFSQNKSWKSLSLYGVESVYFYNLNQVKNYPTLIEIEEITSVQLHRHIKEANIII